MGEAQRKLLESGKVVSFDFGAPALHMSKGDRRAFAASPDGEEQPDRAVRRAGWQTMVESIAAAFPQGMARQDRQTWAAWQEAWDDDETGPIEVTLGQIDWLRKHLGSSDLKVRPALAQYLEAVLDYLESLKPVEATP